MCQRGWMQEAIAGETGYLCMVVFDICRCHAKEREVGFKDRLGGRKLGDCRLQGAERKAEIRRLITDKVLDQPSPKWTDQATS